VRDVTILGLDTSSEWCSVALRLPSGVVMTREERAMQRHSELILPMIDSVLGESHLRLQDMDAIAFGAGPGSFTGLRIACGVAQGLALGAGLPVVPVSTLEAMAEAVGEPRVVAALDARMDEIYVAGYVREGEAWCCVVPPTLCAVSDVPLLQGEGWTGCGSAFTAHESALRARFADALCTVRPDIYPHAREVAAIGARTHASGGSVDPQDAVPLYVRDKVAMTVAERRAAKAGA
jgi:tRNA threonylcarbamoyladenosine biosynthesis protein TsaB